MGLSARQSSSNEDILPAFATTGCDKRSSTSTTRWCDDGGDGDGDGVGDDENGDGGDGDGDDDGWQDVELAMITYIRRLFRRVTSFLVSF